MFYDPSPIRIPDPGIPMIFKHLLGIGGVRDLVLKGVGA